MILGGNTKTTALIHLGIFAAYARCKMPTDPVNGVTDVAHPSVQVGGIDLPALETAHAPLCPFCDGSCRNSGNDAAGLCRFTSGNGG
jgi:hypothetical protein